MHLTLYQSIFFTLLSFHANAALVDYLSTVGQLLGYNTQQTDNQLSSSPYIPYEVSVADEKFISEASKLTGLTLSELDSCQHKVILKLQTDCNGLNDEQLAKLAVQLLNCQSYIEGRKIYPCTDTMSIKDCTMDMDSDTWTSYHLMSNRARAVCYSIRQIQFRGLAEQTVNKLMESSQRQLGMLGRIAEEQEVIQEVAKETLGGVVEGHKELRQQQKDLMQAQLHGQLVLESNINRLVEEKRLIGERHRELEELSRDMRGKILEASRQIQQQAGESKSNHQELLDDIIAIQNKANIIFQRIEDSSKFLLEQSELAREQYQNTLNQLAEVNATIHNLVSIVNGTKKILEERLAWLTSALGGTDLVVERLYLIVWHSSFLLLGMVASAFLAAPFDIRLMVATIPPVNLALALGGYETALDFFGLSITLLALISVHFIFVSAAKLFQNRQTLILTWTKTPEKPVKVDSSEHTYHNASSHSFQSPMSTIKESYELDERKDEVDNSDFWTPTPPASRSGRSRTPNIMNGSYKGSCLAKTRLGTPCKLSSLPGRDFCHRHQSGSSVIMS